MNSHTRVLLLCFAGILICAATSYTQELRRGSTAKPAYTHLGDYLNTNVIVLKIQDEAEAPMVSANHFTNSTGEWSQLNDILTKANAAQNIAPSFSADKRTLELQRNTASKANGLQLADLSRYYDVTLDPSLSETEKISLITRFNSLSLVEIAYFPAIPKLPIADAVTSGNFQGSQDYLSPAPAGVDAYYAWGNPGGKGQNIKLVDIEGNWVEHHEDIRGGASTFHIAGGVIADPTWYMHGTAVLGEIASDSNGFGNTGIAYQVNLGTVSIGTMSIPDAINTAVANTVPGDVILLELQIGGPNAGAYVPVEFEQATFDAIEQGTAMGRIIVEAGANGGQNLDDAGWYGNMFNPSFRFSGAIMVGAANHMHFPEGFSSYGQRVDVHGYGQDVYTLGYGDLAGSDTTNYYTAQFSGTSSASPIITGSCIVLQGVHKATYGTVMNHAEMRSLLQTYSTPQVSSPRHIGPMPNLRGAIDDIIGVSFSADTVFGLAPLGVDFSAASGLAVDSWAWSFGDGDSAFIQNPSHTYTESGLFNVTVNVTAGADSRSKTRPQYIAVLADTIHGANVAGSHDSLVEVVVSGNNTVPLTTIKVAVDLSGTLGASVEDFSTVGCRTAFMGTPTISHFISADGQFTLRLNSTSSPLPPGNGPILKLYFRIPSSATVGQTTNVSLAGYTGHASEFSGIYPLYNPKSTSSTISVCQQRGDVNSNGTVTIQDLTFLVNFLFNGGPTPSSLPSADVNCSNTVSVLDLTTLVAYLFAGGPAPCSC